MESSVSTGEKESSGEIKMSEMEISEFSLGDCKGERGRLMYSVINERIRIIVTFHWFKTCLASGLGGK